MGEQHVVTLDGPLSSALTHFAGWGLLAIVGDALGNAPRLRWTDEAHPRLQVRIAATPEQLGVIVRRHAQHHTTEHSWASARVMGASHAETSLFAVRFKPPSDIEEWPDHFRQRDAHLDEALDGWGSLDDRFLTALGEPAWWRVTEGRSADEGASRWEMKTRNRGEEFLANRFTQLAQTVAARSPEGVIAGITGERALDEAGKDAPESRSSTGFKTPGPTDNALAWCALWGISMFPTVRQSRGISQTAAVWPRTITHPTRATLPVFTEWVNWAHARAVVASKAFDVLNNSSEDGVPGDSALSEQGLVAVVRYPILKAGSSSAPERMLLDGLMEPL